MFVKKVTSWNACVWRGIRYPRDLFVVGRGFEVRQGTLVPINSRNGTLVLARDCLELVVDFGHHFDVDGVGVAIKLRTMTTQILFNLKYLYLEMQLILTIKKCKSLT